MGEKRAIVAVVLIFVVLFGFNYWQNQQRQKMATEQAGMEAAGEPVESPIEGATPAGDEEARGSTTPGMDTAEAGSADDTTIPVDSVDETVPERTITVDAPLWTATLSNRGGSVTSWELKDYRLRLDPEDHAPALVSLVPDGARALALSLDYGPNTLELDGWVFESKDPSYIDLTDGRESVMVRYSAVGPEGITVVREHTFYADSFSFETRVDVSGLWEPSGRRSLWIGWPGVRPTEAKEDGKAPASVMRIDGGIAKDGLGRFKERVEFPRVGAVTVALLRGSDRAGWRHVQRGADDRGHRRAKRWVQDRRANRGRWRVDEVQGVCRAAGLRRDISDRCGARAGD